MKADANEVVPSMQPLARIVQMLCSPQHYSKHPFAADRCEWRRLFRQMTDSVHFREGGDNTGLPRALQHRFSQVAWPQQHQQVGRQQLYEPRVDLPLASSSEKARLPIP
jgi:hypothetical protein